jgi:hypothetical protein
VTPVLGHSPGLWNRTHFDWRSDETLAQVLDRGTLADWRMVYQRAKVDPELRSRVHRLVLTVPLPLPRFWLSALASLGESVDVGAAVPDYYSHSSV